MQTSTYQRKAFQVEAVRVTEENLVEVAQWCGGHVKRQPSTKTSGAVESFIKVSVHRPLNAKQTQAFVGDWVLKAEAGFKVYTNRAFVTSFEKTVVYTEADALSQLQGDVKVTEENRGDGNLFVAQEGLQELRTPELSEEDLAILQGGK